MQYLYKHSSMGLVTAHCYCTLLPWDLFRLCHAICPVILLIFASLSLWILFCFGPLLQTFSQIIVPSLGTSWFSFIFHQFAGWFPLTPSPLIHVDQLAHTALLLILRSELWTASLSTGSSGIKDLVCSRKNWF